MVKVNKKFGKTEEFNAEKIYNTALRAGASPDLARTVSDKVSKRVYEGIRTSEILKMVKKFLGEERLGLASRYDLKKSLARLGPTGFPFETFIGSLLNIYGYKTRLRQLVRGRCVTHEIDVMAEISDSGGLIKAIVECKFRGDDDMYIGLKEALYTYARFLDINEGSLLGLCEPADEVWLVCNTKASDQAVQYSDCKKIKLLTWNYPPQNSLRDLIHRRNAYPVTVLSSLSRENLKRFMWSNIVLVRDLSAYTPSGLSEKFKIKRRNAEKILKEAAEVLS